MFDSLHFFVYFNCIFTAYVFDQVQFDDTTCFLVWILDKLVIDQEQAFAYSTNYS